MEFVSSRPASSGAATIAELLDNSDRGEGAKWSRVGALSALQDRHHDACGEQSFGPLALGLN